MRMMVTEGEVGLPVEVQGTGMMLVVAAIVFSEGVREEPILGRAVGS